MPPKKRKRVSASPQKKSKSNKTLASTAPITTTTTTTQPTHINVQATGELQYLVAEAVVNVDVTVDTILANVPGTVRVTPFEDWTVCLNHPKPPFSRKVRVRRSKYGHMDKNATSTDPSQTHTWEMLEVTRKRQHKGSNKGRRISRIRQESITSCQCSDNAQTFFESIGHTLDREFVRRGTSTTIKLANGSIEMKIFHLYKSLDDANKEINQSPLLVELAAAVQDFADQAGSSRSELCGMTVRRTLNQLHRYVQVVCVPPGKKEYDEYGKFV